MINIEAYKRSMDRAEVKMERFSKKWITEILEKKIERMEEDFGFKPDDGYNQVIGKGEKTNREYGEYSCLLNIVENILD